MLGGGATASLHRGGDATSTSWSLCTLAAADDGGPAAPLVQATSSWQLRWASPPLQVAVVVCSGNLRDGRAGGALRRGLACSGADARADCWRQCTFTSSGGVRCRRLCFICGPGRIRAAREDWRCAVLWRRRDGLPHWYGRAGVSACRRVYQGGCDGCLASVDAPPRRPAALPVRAGVSLVRLPDREPPPTMPGTWTCLGCRCCATTCPTLCAT